MEDEEFIIPMPFEDPEGNIHYIRNHKEFDDMMNDDTKRRTWRLILG